MGSTNDKLVQRFQSSGFPGDTEKAGIATRRSVPVRVGGSKYGNAVGGRARRGSYHALIYPKIECVVDPKCVINTTSNHRYPSGGEPGGVSDAARMGSGTGDPDPDQTNMYKADGGICLIYFWAGLDPKAT